MLELMLRLIDYLVKLSERRESVSATLFDRVVAPTYQVAEAITQHYLVIFAELRGMVESKATREELATYIERKRLEYLPARMRLRELLAQNEPWQALQSKDKFVSGIYGVMCGGLGTYEDQQFDIQYVKTSHTLLDLIYHIRRGSDTFLNHRLIELIDHQETIVKKAWSDVAVGYNAMMTQLTTSNQIEFTKHRRR